MSIVQPPRIPYPLADDDRAGYDLPPQNFEAEDAVLGSLMLDPTMLPQVIKVIAAEDFYTSDRRAVFQAIVALAEQGRGTDLVTLTDALLAAGNLERVGGPDFLVSLLEVVPSSAMAVPYAEIVKECSVRRSLMALGRALIQGAVNRAEIIPDILGEAGLKLNELAAKFHGPGGFDLQAAIQRVLRIIAGGDPGIAWPSGNEVIDEVTGGLRRKTMWVLGAKTRHCKTALASALTDATLRQGLSALHARYEEPPESILLRIASLRTGIPYAGAIKGTLLEIDRDVLSATVRALGVEYQDKFWCLDAPDLPEIEATVRERRPALVVVDTVQRMAHRIATRHQGKRHDLHIGALTSWLENLSVEYDCCVVLTSQVGRGGEGRVPGCADLREAGSIEEDGDVVLMLYWPLKGRELRWLREPDKFVIGFGKNRPGGWTGTRVMAINPETQALSSVESFVEDDVREKLKKGEA